MKQAWMSQTNRNKLFLRTWKKDESDKSNKMYFNWKWQRKAGKEKAQFGSLKFKFWLLVL